MITVVYGKAQIDQNCLTQTKEKDKECSPLLAYLGRQQAGLHYWRCFRDNGNEGVVRIETDNSRYFLEASSMDDDTSICEWRLSLGESTFIHFHTSRHHDDQVSESLLIIARLIQDLQIASKASTITIESLARETRGDDDTGIYRRPVLPNEWILPIQQDEDKPCRYEVRNCSLQAKTLLTIHSTWACVSLRECTVLEPLVFSNNPFVWRTQTLELYQLSSSHDDETIIDQFYLLPLLIFVSNSASFSASASRNHRSDINSGCPLQELAMTQCTLSPPVLDVLERTYIPKLRLEEITLLYLSSPDYNDNVDNDSHDGNSVREQQRVTVGRLEIWNAWRPGGSQHRHQRYKNYKLRFRRLRNTAAKQDG